MNNKISSLVLVIIGVLCVFIIQSNPEVLESAPKGMVLIPAGEFQMGSYDIEGGENEQPVHTVYVDAFYIDIHEVTNAEYKEFLDANPQWQKGKWWQIERIRRRFHNGTYLKDWNGNNYPEGKGDHPVEVSWYAAMAYAQWTGKRLPTEAEWEKAARGGLVGKSFPWGDSIDASMANYGGIVGDSTPVGIYPANGYGLYDMTGNEFEWCLDEYDQDFYKKSPYRNPIAGANNISWLINNFTKIKTSRVVRDGCDGCVPHAVRVADRTKRYPAYSSFGFRCVKTVTP